MDQDNFSIVTRAELIKTFSDIDDKINDLQSPILFIAGTQDAHTTQSESERLYNAARSPKEIWIVPGAGHFNMHNYAGKEYERHVLAFLAQHLHRDAQ